MGLVYGIIVMVKNLMKLILKTECGMEKEKNGMKIIS